MTAIKVVEIIQVNGKTPSIPATIDPVAILALLTVSFKLDLILSNQN